MSLACSCGAWFMYGFAGVIKRGCGTLQKHVYVQAKRKYSFVSGAPGDENKSHAGGRKKNFFGKCIAIDIAENSYFHVSGSQFRVDELELTYTTVDQFKT